MAQGLSWSYWDYLILGIYFLLMVVASFYFRARQSSEDFFLGSGRVPAIISALSIYATLLSSISYLAIPAAVYTDGIVMALSPIGASIFLLLVAKFIVPKFRNMDLVSGYDFLEYRFGYAFKLIASASFVVFHIIRIAIVIFLPALSFQLILPDISIIWLLVLTSLLCIGYSSFAGIVGISYIDSLQALLFIIGAVVVIWISLSALPENMSLIQALGAQHKLLTAEHFSADLHKHSFWGIVIGHGIFGSVYLYIASQDIIQRYKITPTLRDAQKSVLYNIPLLFVSILIFAGIGSALIIFFNYGGHSLPTDLNSQAILPYFIIHFLPSGLSGLLIITILAATQSTISSSINATTMCILNDFGYLRGFSKFKQAQILSVLIGILGTALAYHFIQIGQEGIFKLIVSIAGQIGGPIAGLFLAGFFLPKVRSRHAWIGLIIGAGFSLYIANPLNLNYPNLQINAFLVPFTTIATAFIPCYLASIIWKSRETK